MTTATILVINTGTSANKGDGDSLRTAFWKVNQNFQILGATSGFNTNAIIDVVAPAFTQSNTDYGIQYFYNTNTHIISASLTTATTATIGGVKIGAGISINREGVISAAAAYILPTASPTVIGGVRVGNGLSINQLGILTNAGVTQFNGRSGQVTLSTTDIETALGYTPANAFLEGQPNGIATLDAQGHIPLTQLSDAVLGALNYAGTWNASTNRPVLTASTGTKGSYYKVSFAGTFNLDGIAVWNVGDLALFNGANWDKIDGLVSEVVSVAGRTGDVVLNYSDLQGQVTQRSVFSSTVTATNIALGVVKIGAGIQASSDGTISVDTRAVSTATTSTLGLIKIGPGLTASGDGTVTANVNNGIQDITFNVATLGTLNPNEDLTLAPTSGNIRVNNTLVYTAGNNSLVLRTNQFLNAGLATDSTNFSLRIVGDSNSGANLFDAGIYNSPIATTGWSSKMLLRKNGNLTLAGSLQINGVGGIIFPDGSSQTTAAVITTATVSTVGGIIVGNGLVIDGSGVLSATAGTTGGQISNLGPRTLGSSTDSGQPGNVAYDGSYFYLCVATNSWVRIPIASGDAPGTW
jgi:hypothetical protein